MLLSNIVYFVHAYVRCKMYTELVELQKKFCGVRWGQCKIYP